MKNKLLKTIIPILGIFLLCGAGWLTYPTVTSLTGTETFLVAISTNNQQISSANLKAWINANSITNNLYSVITTNAGTSKTNELFVTVAGTTAALGHYGRVGAFGVSGQYFTNFNGTGFICEDHQGIDPSSVNVPQVPFYISLTTNNTSVSDTSMPMMYFNPIGLTSQFWTNTFGDQGNWPGATTTGAAPMPIVVYGTNSPTYSTNVINLALLSLRQNTNTLYVDGAKGNDALAVIFTYPFKTCTAAKNFAQSGTKIIVLAGNYYENDLLKNGVDWKFEKGIIGLDDYYASPYARRAIFDDYSGAITSNIEGDILHYTSWNDSSITAILITNPATTINISFNLADVSLYGSLRLDYSGAYVPITPRQTFPNGSSGAGWLLSVVNCAKVNADFKEIYTTPRDLTFSNPDQNASLAYPTFGQIKNYYNVPIGFYWVQGEEHISWDNGVFIRPNFAKNYMIWVDSNNTVTNDTSLFVKADRAYGYFYGDGASTTSASWINIRQWQGDAAAVLIYPSSKYYFTGEKIYNTNISNSPIIDFSDALPSGAAGKAWISYTKMSSPNSWISVGSQNTVIANIMQLEDTGNGTFSTGIVIGNSHTNTVFNLTSQQSSTSGALLSMGNGKVTINDLNFDNSSGTKASIFMQAASGLILNGVNIKSPVITNSIICASNTIVKVLGGNLENAVGTNVTLIGSFTSQSTAFNGNNPIFQSVTTNLTAATSFTYVWPIAYKDTNYQATIVGNGTTIVSGLQTDKTTTGVTFTMTAFTGSLTLSGGH